MADYFLPYYRFPIAGVLSSQSKHRLVEKSKVTIKQNIAKSLQESVNEPIMNEIPKVIASLNIMFVYVSLSLGNLNCVENRVIDYLDCLFHFNQ